MVISSGMDFRFPDKDADLSSYLISRLYRGIYLKGKV